MYCFLQYVFHIVVAHLPTQIHPPQVVAFDWLFFSR